MTTITNFSSYRDLSLRQAWNLKRTSDALLNSGSIADPVYQKNVQDWRTVADRLNKSVQASLPFSRLLWELVTLVFIKKFILRLSLPIILRQTDLKIAQMKRLPATPLQRNVQKVWQDYKNQSSLEVITKAYQYFQAHRGQLMNTVPTHNQSFWTPAITPATPSYLNLIERQVDEYFRNKITLAQSGHAISIPRLFHATRSDANGISILASSELKQSNAPAGMGVYVSTIHESLAYGNLCIALDLEAIAESPVSYFPSHAYGSISPQGVWFRIEENVPVKWHTVAHIVVEKESHETQLRQELAKVEKTLSDDAAVAATCPIVYIHANNVISECLRNSSPKPLILNPNWKRHSRCAFLANNPFPTGLHAQEAVSFATP